MIINSAYFSSLTTQINEAGSCAELQKLVTSSLTAIVASQTSATAQLATITPMLALLTAPASNPGAIVTWITSLINDYLTPQLVPYTTLAAQLTATVAEIAALTSAIESAAAKFSNCTVTIP